MARRPLNKRKQRAKIVKKPIAEARTEAEKDPFYIDPKFKKPGRAYQWVAITHGSEYDPFSIDEQCRKSGWKPVPLVKNVGNQRLMWAPQKVADAQRQANTDLAIAMDNDIRAALGMDVNGALTDRGKIGLITTEWLDRALAFDKRMEELGLPSKRHEYTPVPSNAPSIEVEVTTKFRMSARFQDAAACIGITPEMYAQRRVALYLQGQFGGILLPIDGAFELFEDGNFTIQSRK